MDEITWNGATEITEGGTYDEQTYTSTSANQNAVLINTSGNVTLNTPTVTKSGGGDSSDNSSFYGTNAAVLAMGGGKTTITGGTVNTSASGANGIFSYGGNGGTNGASGDGTTVVINDTTINTTGDASGGIMTTGGGTTKANNLTVTTSGRSSAPIRSDRGGGSVTVSGGSYTSSGLGSPAIYSTAKIVVENASLTSNLSEGVCIEGQNSVALTNCTLTASNTQTNGNATFLDGVILYQSMSGDSSSGTATFSMTGGTFNNKSGHAFHVTNTNAVINLNNVTLNNSSGVLLSVCDDGWSGVSNVATLNASAQELTGDILVGDDSTLTLNLTNGATLTGNISGSITNARGTAVSSEIGTVNVSLDSTSKWILTGDAYISDFSGNVANIVNNGYTVYVNNVALDGTSTEDNTNSTVVSGGLTFSADGSALTVDSSFGGDTIDLNLYPEVKVLDATGVSVDSSSGLTIIGNTQDNTISAPYTSSNNICAVAGNNLVTLGGAFIDRYNYTGGSNDTVVGFTPNLDGDRLIITAPVTNIVRAGNNVAIGTAYGTTLLLETNNTTGSIFYSGDGENFNSAQIGDQNSNTMTYYGDDFNALGQPGALIITGTGDNDVRLDGSTGQAFVNVLNLDASTATGNNSLGGDANNNILIGGSGANVLWGGADVASDTLIGGGVNNFFLGKGNGNDIALNSSSTDAISLFDATLSDIIATAGTGNAVAVAFNTGSVVMVGSNEALSASFLLADGGAYRFNHATQSWQGA